VWYFCNVYFFAWRVSASIDRLSSYFTIEKYVASLISILGSNMQHQVYLDFAYIFEVLSLKLFYFLVQIEGMRSVRLCFFGCIASLYD